VDTIPQYFIVKPKIVSNKLQAPLPLPS